MAAGMVKGQAGAEYIALGKNLANSSAVFCLANNPAVLAPVKQSFGFWGSNKFTGTPIIHGGIAANLILKNTGLGLNSGYFGTTKSNRFAAELNIGQRITEKFSLGVALGFTKFTQGLDYGNTAKITGKLGANIQINTNIDLGVVLVNPWLSVNQSLAASPQLHFSAGYKVNAQTKLWAQYHNESGMPAVYGLALKYTATNPGIMAALQTGMEPISIGIVYDRSNMRFAFASSYHLYLGFTPSFTCIWLKQ